MNTSRFAYLEEDPSNSAPQKQSPESSLTSALRKIYQPRQSEERYDLSGSIRTSVSAANVERAIHGGYNEDEHEGEIISIEEASSQISIVENYPIETFSVNDLYRLGPRERLAFEVEGLVDERLGKLTTTLHNSNERYGINAWAAATDMPRQIRNGTITHKVDKFQLAKNLLGERLIIEGQDNQPIQKMVSHAWKRYAEMQLLSSKPKKYGSISQTFSDDIPEDILVLAGYMNIPPEIMFARVINHQIQERFPTLQESLYAWMKLYVQKHPGQTNPQQELYEAYLLCYEMFQEIHGQGENSLYGTHSLIPFTEEAEEESISTISSFLKVDASHSHRRISIIETHYPFIEIRTAGDTHLRKIWKTKDSVSDNDIDKARELNMGDSRFDYRAVSSVGTIPIISILPTGNQPEDIVTQLTPGKSIQTRVSQLQEHY